MAEVGLVSFTKCAVAIATKVLPLYLTFSISPGKFAVLANRKRGQG